MLSTNPAAADDCSPIHGPASNLAGQPGVLGREVQPSRHRGFEFSAIRGFALIA